MDFDFIPEYINTISYLNSFMISLRLLSGATHRNVYSMNLRYGSGVYFVLCIMVN